MYDTTEHGSPGPKGQSLTRSEVEGRPPHVHRVTHTKTRVAHQVEQVAVPNLK